MNQNVTIIKPKVLIKILEDYFPDQNISGTFMMPPSYIGSLTLLESAMLLAFVKLIRPKKVFEFGTFMGHTSVFFAKNIAEDAKVHTLDVPQNYAVNDGSKTKASEVDSLLRDQSVTLKAKCITNENKEVKRKINPILCNSLEFETDKLQNSVDLVFIDGGHETHIISSDTIKATEMITEKGVIVWHDYKSDVFTDVTEYVDKFSQSHKVFHIAHTNIAFMWKSQEELLLKTHRSFS
ncbi:class I SAM-dependent methyltransferase [Pseudoalteromonas sp. MMG012]|uniref:class I SAM-dependent methyltransferase n=1 Tax=Pseudoalteromonas sp. MMG012 TaxID=2822686 RepID=UPI001B39F8E1|nr:class I SAM-dependent methyltransferase [Pseudoalteromonas sp. MMG012]MBQ4849019.1 class I SAM-dependent methyltransferase [Pseudoalteromonas sp. MMG012]